MNFQKKFISAILLIFSVAGYGQVQLSDETNGIAPNLPPSIDASGPLNEVDSDEMELPAFSPLSDPEELLLIEGLDEPMERLKLRDQDTNMILDMIQMITGRYILRPQNLPAVKITFDSMSVLTKRETLLAVESLLSMNGIGITKINDKFYKAVPAGNINTQVPIWLDAPASSIRPSQRIYVKMFYLKYAPVEKMREALNAFATPNQSSLLVFPHANALMITDSLLNLQRMEKVIEMTDIQNESIQQEVFNYEMKRFDATEFINEMLEPLIMEEGKEGDTANFSKNFQIKPQFIPVAGGKQLMVICHERDRDLLEKIITELDVQIEVKFESKLFPLYHADAGEVFEVISQLLQADQGGSSSGGTSSARTPSSTRSTATPSSGASSPRARSTGRLSIPNSTKFSEYARQIVDFRSNGIFGYGTEKDLEEFEDVIRKLDTPLPMAQIETIFVMVDLDERNSRGIDALFSDLQYEYTPGGVTQVTDPGPDGVVGGGDDITRNVLTDSNKKLEGNIGFPFLDTSASFVMNNWKINALQWGQIFNLATERSDVRIFSTPTLTVLHGGSGASSSGSSIGGGASRNSGSASGSSGNTSGGIGSGSGSRGGGGSAYIRITDEIKVALRGGQEGVNNYIAPSIETYPATTEMRILEPRIRPPKVDELGNIIDKGSIYMGVEVQAEKFDFASANEFDGQKIPGKKTRYATSYLSIDDGEIVVLGGLQEVQLDTSSMKYNLLSDIPILGEKFFRPKQSNYKPTELMIFLRPRIIDPTIDPSSVNTDLIDARVSREYKPVFTSPSGKILNDANQDKGEMKPLKKDLPSTKVEL
ncbi:MAG: hypothetical protein VXZ32_06205 [Verrucomicrobiota bacterium]|nr:hypothetical protein [Verrucomicrobiota bacterium]